MVRWSRVPDLGQLISIVRDCIWTDTNKNTKKEYTTTQD